jgi:hypothetical protein
MLSLSSYIFLSVRSLFVDLPASSPASDISEPSPSTDSRKHSTGGEKKEKRPSVEEWPKVADKKQNAAGAKVAAAASVAASAAKKTIPAPSRKKVENDMHGHSMRAQPQEVKRRLIIYVATAVLGGQGNALLHLGWGDDV